MKPCLYECVETALVDFPKDSKFQAQEIREIVSKRWVQRWRCVSRTQVRRVLAIMQDDGIVRFTERVPSRANGKPFTAEVYIMVEPPCSCPECEAKRRAHCP